MFTPFVYVGGNTSPKGVEMLRSLTHFLLAQRAMDITPSITWRREAWNEEAVEIFLQDRTR